MSGQRLDRLAKLVALAADQAGTPEGELARTRAEQLAAEMGVAVDGDPIVTEYLSVKAADWCHLLMTAAAILAGGHWASRRCRGVFVGRRSSWLLFNHLVEYFQGRHASARAQHMKALRAAWDIGDDLFKWDIGSPALAASLRRALGACAGDDASRPKRRAKALRRAGALWSRGFAMGLYAQALDMLERGWRAVQVHEARGALREQFAVSEKRVGARASRAGFAAGRQVPIHRPAGCDPDADRLALDGP